MNEGVVSTMFQPLLGLQIAQHGIPSVVALAACPHFIMGLFMLKPFCAKL
jgi:hypothetical protein